jgi:hypothetical protein
MSVVGDGGTAIFAESRRAGSRSGSVELDSQGQQPYRWDQSVSATRNGLLGRAHTSQKEGGPQEDDVAARVEKVGT